MFIQGSIGSSINSYPSSGGSMYADNAIPIAVTREMVAPTVLKYQDLSSLQPGIENCPSLSYRYAFGIVSTTGMLQSVHVIHTTMEIMTNSTTDTNASSPDTSGQPLSRLYFPPARVTPKLTSVPRQRRTANEARNPTVFHMEQK